MSTELIAGIERRAAVHAALADPTRLRIVDELSLGDLAPSALAAALELPSNLLAHHLNVLEQHGLLHRHRSEGDRRRTYLHLIRAALADLGPPAIHGRERVLFVCTANSARSHLAAALWRRASPIPAVSAGTWPAARIDPGAVAAAARHHLPLRRLRPRAIGDVQADGDLLITVCDLAHEQIGGDLHWSIPDPVRVGTESAFDQALAELGQRVSDLAPRLTASTNSTKEQP